MSRLKLVPWKLLASAVAFIVAGILWAVWTGVAIPDQDPTPAMQADARAHLRVVEGLMLGGVALFAIAFLSILLHVARRPVPYEPLDD